MDQEKARLGCDIRRTGDTAIHYQPALPVTNIWKIYEMEIIVFLFRERVIYLVYMCPNRWYNPLLKM